MLMAKSTSPLGETVEVEPGAAVDDILGGNESTRTSLKTEVQKIDSDRDANAAVENCHKYESLKLSLEIDDKR